MAIPGGGAQEGAWLYLEEGRRRGVAVPGGGAKEGAWLCLEEELAVVCWLVPGFLPANQCPQACLWPGVPFAQLRTKFLKKLLGGDAEWHSHFLS